LAARVGQNGVGASLAKGGEPVPHRLEDPAAMADALRAVRAGTAWRGESLARKVAYGQRQGLDLTLKTDPREIDDALERHIGSVDLLDAVWLRQAADAADAVAQLEAPAGNGTGFLISPWLLLTNHHVVPTPDDATETKVHFRYEKNAAGKITRTRDHRMDPGRFFITSPPSALDFTLVALTPTARGRPPSSDFGHIPLIGATGKILLGQPVNIIQHPDGRPREIAIRNNRLLNIEDTRQIVYETDTESGASGAPVFNDRWEVVGLHYSSVDAKDEQGRPIDRNGDPVTRNTPEHLRNWAANAGIRVSAIVTDIEGRTYDTNQQPLVDELLGRRR
jgi:endonuclease G, mitochondrial